MTVQRVCKFILTFFPMITSCWTPYVKILVKCYIFKSVYILKRSVINAYEKFHEIISLNNTFCQKVINLKIIDDSALLHKI